MKPDSSKNEASRWLSGLQLLTNSWLVALRPTRKVWGWSFFKMAMWKFKFDISVTFHDLDGTFNTLSIIDSWLIVVSSSTTFKIQVTLHQSKNRSVRQSWNKRTAKRHRKGWWMSVSCVLEGLRKEVQGPGTINAWCSLPRVAPGYDRSVFDSQPPSVARHNWTI